MKNKEALNLVNCLILNYNNFTSKRYKKLDQSKYDSIYGDWDTKTWYGLRNLFFVLITQEANFDSFYKRFDAPGSTKGERPVAWDDRFIPDLINDEIFDSDTKFDKKVKRIQKLYSKCLKLEKAFNK